MPKTDHEPQLKDLRLWALLGFAPLSPLGKFATLELLVLGVALLSAGQPGDALWVFVVTVVFVNSRLWRANALRCFDLVEDGPDRGWTTEHQITFWVNQGTGRGDEMHGWRCSCGEDHIKDYGLEQHRRDTGQFPEAP